MRYVSLAEALMMLDDESVIEIGVFKNTVPVGPNPLPEPWVLLDSFKDAMAPTGEDIYIFQNPLRRYPRLRHVWNKPNVVPFTYHWWTPLGLVERVHYFEWTGFGWVFVA